MDFTSALYLGLSHPSETIRWKELTQGTPAALRPPEGAPAAERAFAALVGCERAQVFTSTLHAFSDLFAQIGERGGAVLYDDGVYPIARWGMERAERRGARVLPFAHHRPAALLARLRQLPSSIAHRWVVADGFCTGCTRPAPLVDYADLAHRYRARLLIDDTQAVGLYGKEPDRGAPYGRGGGGSLCRFPLERRDVVLVASLAKAFGAPLTMVGGPGAFMAPFCEASETLVHCSPPSAPSVTASLAALSWNTALGDGARARLATMVTALRRALAARGLRAEGGLFPMQRVLMPDLATANAVASEMARRHVRIVVQRLRCTQRVALTFIVTTRHSPPDLEEAAVVLEAAARRRCPPFVDNRSHMEA
jgi:8-amino-7-oxononanoate synthase